jgi:hypothetical protein
MYYLDQSFKLNIVPIKIRGHWNILGMGIMLLQSPLCTWGAI